MLDGSLARVRGRESQEVFGTFMARVLAVVQTEEDAGRAGQSGLADFLGIAPDYFGNDAFAHFV